MVPGILFLSTVRVCSVACKIRKGPYAGGSTSLYLSALLSAYKVTSDAQFTYTIFPIKQFCKIRIFGRIIVYISADLSVNFRTPLVTLRPLGPADVPLRPWRCRC